MGDVMLYKKIDCHKDKVDGVTVLFVYNSLRRWDTRVTHQSDYGHTLLCQIIILIILIILIITLIIIIIIVTAVVIIITIL